MEGIDTSQVRRLVEAAIEEDIGPGDVTSDSVIPKGLQASAVFIAKREGVAAGIPLVDRIYSKLDPGVLFEATVAEGTLLKTGTLLGKLTGSARSILTGERVCLNFLQRLSGIATLTHDFVQRVKGTNVPILDTRKTTPAWRCLEKYAVRVGGGDNHRMGLYDQILLKDNHMKALAASEGLSPAEATVQAIRHARVQTPPGTFIGVEVTRLEELRAALPETPDLILLDNMSVDEIRQCVALVREIESQKRPLLEVSGGVSLDNVRRLAETGIDRISIGALTHSAPALDIALELE